MKRIAPESEEQGTRKRSFAAVLKEGDESQHVGDFLVQKLSL